MPFQKEKKINVKFFLNTLVEPVTGEKGKEYYPLYIQVTYNRKNTQFKSKYGEYYEELKEVKSSLLTFEERVLRKIIRMEAGDLADYDLKGLKRKYDLYSTSIGEAIEYYLKPKLRLAILKTNNELVTVLDFSQIQATVGRLHKAANLLFKDFDKNLNVKLKEELTAYENYYRLYPLPFFDYDFPTLMDWKDNSYKTELEKKLKASFKKPEIIKGILNLVDHAVIEKLKELGI
jgi:hypothetical protein